MSVLPVVGAVLIALGVIGTLLPLLPYDDYWIRMWDYPRSQLAVLLLGGATLIAVTIALGHAAPWHRWALGAAVASLAFQVFRIFPYTALAPVQVPAAAGGEADSAREFRLLVCNVLQDNDRYGAFADLVREVAPDVVLTLETNHAWADALAAEGFTEAFPHHVAVPRENRYGMHLWSRLPLRDAEVLHLVSDSIPSIRTSLQLPNGHWVKFYGVHPAPPSPTEESGSTGRDAELALVGELVRDDPGTDVVVAGDLNDVAWSHSTRLFQRVSGLLDPRRGRGLYSTFHADHWWARWPLDHVFHARAFQLVSLQRLRHIGSDHFPVSVTLRYVPERQGETEAPVPERDDLEEAVETVDQAREGKVDGLLIKE